MSRKRQTKQNKKARGERSRAEEGFRGGTGLLRGRETQSAQQGRE